MQHNAHCTQRKLALVNAKLAVNDGRGPDEYFSLKDLARELSAKLAGTTARRYDPAGFWYGGQSN